MKIKLVILPLLIFAISCKKKVVCVDENFIGTWETIHASSEVYLKITNDSKGEFRFWSNLSQEGEEGFQGVARCKGNKLKIGSLNTLTIVEFPHLIDTAQLLWNRPGPKPNWKIVIRGSVWRTSKGIWELYTLK